MSDNPLPFQLAAQAEEIVNTLIETHYKFSDGIDPDTGVYDCDCSIFVGYILKALAPDHFKQISQIEANRVWPRAFEYYDFLSSLVTNPVTGWSPVSRLADAARGDVVAWSTGLLEAGKDTGHVLFLAETPVADESGNLTVRVYDSANRAHFNDTRGDGAEFFDGVGSGFIVFEVAEDGAPVGFLFSPDATEFDELPIAVASPEPFG